MKRRTSFRPFLNDVLEDRAVPTGFGGSSVVAQDALKVSQDFRTFENAFQTAVYNDIQAPSTPNASQFSTDVTAALNALKSSLTTDTANLAATNPNLASTLQGDVTTLQTQLTGLTTPSSANLVRPFERLAFSDIGQAAYQAIRQVQQASPPQGTITQQTLSTVLNQIGTALQTFNVAYFNAVQKDLLASSNNGNPSNGATQFKADVTTALTALQTSLLGTGGTGGALSSLPSSLTSSLTTTLTTDLTNLQSYISNVQIPTSNSNFALWVFRFESAYVIGYGESQVVRDVLSAVHTYNNSLTG